MAKNTKGVVPKSVKGTAIEATNLPEPTPAEIKTENENFKDVLLSLIDTHYTHIQHYHIQRSTISNILVLSSAAILAFISFDKSLDSSDYFLIGALMLLGIFGIAFSWKYYERTILLYSIYKAYRDALDEKVLDNSNFLKNLEESAETKHKDKYKFIRRTGIWEVLRVSRLWMLFHFIILAFGSTLLYTAKYYPIVAKEAQSNLPIVQPQPASTPSLIPSPATTSSAAPAPTVTPNHPTVTPTVSR
jgi:hypothetical protein